MRSTCGFCGARLDDALFCDAVCEAFAHAHRKANGLYTSVPQRLLQQATGLEMEHRVPIPQHLRLRHGLTYANAPEHYSLDLADPHTRTAVEVDGESHHTTIGERWDHVRDAILRTLGWRVLRYSNDAVRADPESIAHAVRRVIRERAHGRGRR